jgi:nucleotide-binding universal stress UspA family protein
VPLDFSGESLRALDFALPLARRFGARVHFLHVCEGARRFSTVATSPVLWSEAEAKRHLADEVEFAFGTRPRSDHCHLRIGNPHQEIIAAAEELDANLIVIATHGHSGFKQLTLGSTTDNIIRHARCPVLVVREPTRGPIMTAAKSIVLQKILVPVDFSDCAREGARYASVFATAVGANLLLLHVVRSPDYMVATGKAADPNWPQLLETAILQADSKLDEMMNFLPLVGISCDREIEVGSPVDRLTRASARREVDMIIASTHGYSGLHHALLGSVAEQLVRSARCPVLIVPSHLRELP